MMKWFWLRTNVDNYLPHIPVDAHFDLIYVRWVILRLIAVLSFWRVLLAERVTYFFRINSLLYDVGVSVLRYNSSICLALWWIWNATQWLSTSMSFILINERIWVQNWRELRKDLCVRVISRPSVILFDYRRHAAATKATVRSGAPTSRYQAGRLCLLLQNFWRSFYWLWVRLLPHIL